MGFWSKLLSRKGEQDKTSDLLDVKMSEKKSDKKIAEIGKEISNKALNDNNPVSLDDIDAVEEMLEEESVEVKGSKKEDTGIKEEGE